MIRTATVLMCASMIGWKREQERGGGLASQEVRKIIIGSILATDMSQHFSLTNEFKKHESFSYNSPEDRMLLCKTLLHASDLSNPTLSFATNSFISQNVHREFK